ncbi:hypothetical protein ABZ912_42545 [Nonomuraea angiospora]|uniref:hypothetical protein n=1 Tax=Nonomuraea angiospora TaxID=46172 RepID=UPI0033F6307A
MSGDTVQRAALLDQAAAATLDAMELEASLIGGTGFHHQNAPGPHMARCIELMGSLATSEQLALCEHLITGPRPAFWLYWAPTGLLCGDCALQACEVSENPAEGCECARCRLVVPVSMFTVNGFLQVALFDDRDEPPVVVPPLVFRMGLCTPCQQVETAGEA